MAASEEVKDHLLFELESGVIFSGSRVSMDGLTLSRNPVESLSGCQGSYDRLNLSDISLASCESSIGVQWNLTSVAPSLLSNTVDRSPTLSPASSHADPVDAASPNRPWSSRNSEKEGSRSSTSRKGRRKRSRVPQAKGPILEVDKKRSKVLAKNRMAAKRYRTRQKEYVENLERRCKKENEQRRLKSSLVNSLQQEISRLEAEITRQARLCNCMHNKVQRDAKGPQLLT